MKSLDTSEQEYIDELINRFNTSDSIRQHYLFVTLINIHTEQVTLLSSSSKTPDKNLYDTDKDNYYTTLYQNSLLHFVSDEERKYVEEDIRFSHILKELEQKNEYDCYFYATQNHRKRLYQIRFLKMLDGSHILMSFQYLDELVERQRQQIRNNIDKLKKERRFLEVLCRDFTGVYYCNLAENTMEVLKISALSNESQNLDFKTRKVLNYTYELKKYCDQYVVAQDQDTFMKTLNPNTIAGALANNSRFIYRYQCVPNLAGHQFFEVQVLRVKEDIFDNTAMIAFRHIDDVVAMEKRQQQERIASINQTRILQSEKDTAIQANNIKTQFLSSLSHDIRTPINGIQGLLTIAETYSDDLQKQQECREKIGIALNYLETLVSNVLDMNRLESHSIELVEKPFNILDELKKLAVLTEIHTKQQNLHFTVDWEDDYIQHRYLSGSAEGLSRIVMNLSSNAIKYNKPEGSIFWRCREIKSDEDTAWFEFYTSDTGIGMDKEFLKHAFEPYSQMQNSSLSSINGVGLGLSIVKQMIELMHGSIHVESQLGEGTAYTILLPFKINPQPVPLEKESVSFSIAGIHALLVEDNQLNMEIARFYLEQEKVHVTCATNGEEAVKTFSSSSANTFDVILMDVIMPVKDGLTATKQIRSLNREDAKTIPVIGMSANAFEEDIQNSLNAGMNDYITKPLKEETLKQVIAKQLQKKTARR